MWKKEWYQKLKRIHVDYLQNREKVHHEIAGLTLTVPSWVSSIERARNNADMNAASTRAKSKLEEALLSLQEKVSEMLSDIREVD